MRFIRNKFCRLLFPVLMLAFTASKVLAATDPVVTIPLKGSENKVKLNMESYARDTKYFTLSQPNRDSVKNNSIINMVGVGIEETSTKYIPGNFSVTVTLLITAYDKNETATGNATKHFTVTYDTATGAQYRNFEDTVFKNAFAVRAKIISIDSGSINWPVSQVLKVENQLTASRDYYFNCNLALTGLSDSLFIANAELTAFWQQPSININPGVTEYDLEWAWIDEASIDRYKTGNNYNQDLVFGNNATRVTIAGSIYNIPLLYDDTGRIFLRVRPVQWRTDGQRVEGRWSWITNDPSQSPLSLNPVYYVFYGHEAYLNWQASTSFAEDGKRKSVIQYFDGSLRSRQTVTKDNTSNTTVVAEAFYDYQGRAVVQVLPSPTLNTAIGYAHNFNRAVGENTYPKSVYDKLTGGASVCASPAKPFNTDFGTANYYSAQNPMLQTDAASKFIPDATGSNPGEAYAFTETRFSPDGRIAAQGGVGIAHQIGSNHETKYFYEAPAQEELDALFGTDAGVASHYFKNIVKDANGQFSVSYMDMHGRTVATALAGETPKNADGTPMLEALSSQDEVPFTKQLIDEETNRMSGNSIISSKPFVVLKDNSTYSFDYTLAPKQLSLLSCNGQPVCYDCLYQLKFTISSDCSQQLIYIDSSLNFTLGQYLTQCNNGNANSGFTKHFQKILNQGSYTVTKTLTLSSAAQDAYRDIFLANDTCKKFIDFYTQELSVLQANSNCNMTCESCKAAIGVDFQGFRAKFVAESNIPEPLSPEMLVQLQAAFNEAYANCDRMCNNNDGLDLVRNIKQMMLQDVTPPYGQYAQTTPAELARGYNIFKIADYSNLLEGYGGSPVTPDYKRPVQFTNDDATFLNLGTYYDELNQPETYHPATPQEFTDSFKTSWANQLLVHHPEFKKLQLSENQLKTSYLFEANLEKDSTWAQAVSHNYITNMVNIDPFFNGVAPAVYKIRMISGYYNGQFPPPAYVDLNNNPVVNGISNFMVPHLANSCPDAPQYASQYVSMWQVALGAVYCREKAVADPCVLDFSDPNTQAGCMMNPSYSQPQNSFSEGCTTDRDWAWKTFKNLYLAERRKLISAYLNTYAPVFPISFPNNNLPPYQLRFINHANPQSTFDNTGINGAGDIGDIINTINGDINGGTAQAHALELAQYDTVCRGYAATWIAQLRNCPQLNTLFDDPATWVSDSTWLVSRLHAVCKNGSDDGHFLGSSSVKPGNHAIVDGQSYDDFPKVIEEFLQWKGIANPTAECYTWLINVPKPYDKQPALANSYVLTKPTPCECDRISSLRFEWQQSGYAGTFSSYLQYQHGTFISDEQLDALTALCTSNYQCKMLNAPIALPPALQCRGENGEAPQTCISCRDYQAIKSDFNALTNQQAPFAYPQNDEEVGYNHSFAAYANNRTGFSKTWQEYLVFENTCNTNNPTISCESLDSVLNAFYLSPAYLQNPIGINCTQAFVNYFNSYYHVSYTYQYWMSLFAQCGKIPNVCKPRLDCTRFTSLIDGFYNQNGVTIYSNGNCQALFVDYINTQLSSNYTYGQLEAIYLYTCSSMCGKLDICDFPNRFLLTKVFNQFKIDHPQPWNLPDCKQAFVDYFNDYFGLVPMLDPQTIFDFYPEVSKDKCLPSLSDLCNPPYDCKLLETIKKKFVEINDPVDRLPDCQQAFTDYFNHYIGTSYTYAEIVDIYLTICNIRLDVCNTAADCEKMIWVVQKFMDMQKDPATACSFDADVSSCEHCFVDYFNQSFNTSYTTWAELQDLYLKHCSYKLFRCGGVRFEETISSESLLSFLKDFKEKYPDPSTQLGDKCSDYFAAVFNEQFSTKYSFDEIAAYYLQQLNITLDICNSRCIAVNTFLTSFNIQYNTLKLPSAAKEDLFVFNYNKAFLNDGNREDKVEMGYTATHQLQEIRSGAKRDSKEFDPMVKYPSIERALHICGITELNFGTTATITIYDPQVLLSLKQVYYIIHPNGLPDNCQEDFQSWFNAVMRTQYEYKELMNLYNSVCGNNAGFICERPDDGGVVFVDPVTIVDVSNNLPPMLCGLNDPSGTPATIDDDPCKDLPQIAFNTASDKYELYVDSLRNVFDTAYHNKCMAAKSLESFTMSYRTAEYHYTLYYYDQSGNLVKTVPPAGVQKLTGSDLQLVKDYRANVLNGQSESSNQKLPLHTMATEYRYNTLNQVVAQKTPDGGTSNFYYDRLGRLVISQNAKQQAQQKYSYTLYDLLGRITEVGQLSQSAQMSQAISQDASAANSPGSLAYWLYNKAAEQITRTFYDKSYFDGNATLCPDYLCQQNLRNRVSYTAIFATGTVAVTAAGTHDAASFFDYDIHGNVKNLLQDYNTGIMKSTGNRFKKITYDYDLVSGKVNSVAYQPNQTDAFYHRYAYDAENRLTDVETSLDKIVWEKDARYNYYKHGPLARTILGQQQVQGLDYAYTLQGWLKGVNSTATGDGTFDIGQDGKTGSSNSNIARDAYGFSLNYFAGDYKAAGGVSTFAAIGTLPNTGAGLYNGNISAMVVNLPKLGQAKVYGYKYDQLNRIVAMDAYEGLNNATNIFTAIDLNGAYKERITYDANGNIKTYKRNGDAARLMMDDMTYAYMAGTNKLDKVTDAAPDAAANDYDKYNDIKQGQSNGNYTYDAIGNLTSDLSEGITNITWNVYGKIQSITKATGTIYYTYDATGNRISKDAAGRQTWYVRDATGNVMSVYTKDLVTSGSHLMQSEVDMYGSSRLGIWNSNRDVNNITTVDYSAYNSNFIRGNKFFELTNHLGNVLVTVSDKKISIDTDGNGTVDYYQADVITATDYYPFGMAMPGRKYTQTITAKYRYGFNGKENADEIMTGDYAFEARIYESRLGRFFSTDPRESEYAWQSTYTYFSNSPISQLDYNGEGGGDEKQKVKAYANSDINVYENSLKKLQGQLNGTRTKFFNYYIKTGKLTDASTEADFQNALTPSNKSELNRIQTSIQTTTGLLNAAKSVQAQWNKLDKEIEDVTDAFNTKRGFKGNQRLDPNLVKALMFSETEMGAGTDYLSLMASIPKSYPAAVFQLNLGRVTDGNAYNAAVKEFNIPVKWQTNYMAKGNKNDVMLAAGALIQKLDYTKVVKSASFKSGMPWFNAVVAYKGVSAEGARKAEKVWKLYTTGEHPYTTGKKLY